jgi:CRP-like cAMP-binding protein
MNPPPSRPFVEARQAYRWTAALADILTGLRRRFEGDLDQYLLFMVFVQAEMEQSMSARRGPAVGLNALSVAAACGIPRETARTKLHRLTAAGWLRSDADGLHYLSSKSDGAAEYRGLNPLAAPRQ